MSAPQGHFYQGVLKRGVSYLAYLREVDPLSCPKCDGEMKIISFIYKRTVIKKILKHLEMYDEKSSKRAPPVVQIEYTERVKIVPYDDGWPEYEDAVIEI